MGLESLGEKLTGLIAVTTLPLGILAGLFYGLTSAIVVFVVGWLLLVPVLGILTESKAKIAGGNRADDEVQKLVEQRMKEKMEEKLDDPPNRNTTDPVEELRERYARGEIDEAELEHRLDILMEMEDIDPNDDESIERVKRNLGIEESAIPRSSETPDDNTDTTDELSELELDRE